MKPTKDQNNLSQYLKQKFEEDVQRLDKRINEIKEKSIKDMVNDFIKKSSVKKNQKKEEEKKVDQWVVQHKKLKYLKIFSTVAYGLQRDYFVEEKIRQRYQWLLEKLSLAPSGIILRILNQENQEEVYERLKAWMYGIIVPFPQKCSPLHQLIVQNDAKSIENLLLNNQVNDIEEADELGFTPLGLAVRLQRERITAVLLSYGANARLLNCIGMQNPLQWAVTQSQNENLIRMLLKGTVMMEQIGFEQQRQEGEKILNEIEDFSFEMHWWLDSSWIPFCKKLAPSDQYEIFKKGNNFRINWNMGGKQSFIYNSKAKTLYHCFHNSKIAIDIFNLLDRNLISLKKRRIANFQKRVGQQKQEPKIQLTDKIQFKPIVNKQGVAQVEVIEGIETKKYALQTKCKIEIFEYQNIILKQKLDEIAKIHLKEETNELTNYKKLLEKYSLLKDIPTQIFNIFDELLKKKDKKLIKKAKHKTIKTNIWLSESLPLKIIHLIPFLKVLSQNQEFVERILEFFEKSWTKETNSFPIKAEIPLLLTIKLYMQCKNFNFSNNIDDSLFEIPYNYKYPKFTLQESVKTVVMNNMYKQFDDQQTKKPINHQDHYNLQQVLLGFSEFQNQIPEIKEEEDNNQESMFKQMHSMMKQVQQVQQQQQLKKKQTGVTNGDEDDEFDDDLLFFEQEDKDEQQELIQEKQNNN